MSVHASSQTKARAIAAAVVLGAVGAAVALALALQARGDRARCSVGFVAREARCVVEAGHCPRPLVVTTGGCDTPDARVTIPAATIELGPSDWEAEGRVSARSIHVEAFRIDAFEVTRGHWDGVGGGREADTARTASAMTRDQAEAYCASRGGRLPTEDEWIVAAASSANPPRRYPWGDTGAVCRRGAWGLASGPCSLSGDGPDTAGAHPDGDTPLGVHDLAGNVAEWVAADPVRPAVGIVKGGSWRSALASDLRIWARLEIAPASHDPTVGFRCAYPR